MTLAFTGQAYAEDQQNVVKGTVKDASTGEPLIGATVVVKGTTVGQITDLNGKFSIELPSRTATLTITSVGYTAQELAVTAGADLTISLEVEITQISEVVIVGYGQQKKESVVGAISQTGAATLEKRGGITTLGAALTGNVPGVITLSGNGAPGAEDPMIYIRGQGTWNAAGPLILIDGIERTMAGLDINSVESISVLKDASATAVFGVKGANGVILITTKRGQTGKANISIKVNSTMKVPSKLPGKLDSYDALTIRNMAIENELGLSPASWNKITPLPELNKYRNPSSIAEAEQFPNVDWQEASFKDFAMSNQENITVSGGSAFVKYFTSLDYLHEGDVMNMRDNGKGYTPAYGYDAMNFHSNLDINLTSTTTLAANISGFYGDRQTTTNTGFEYTMWQSAYSNAPNSYPVQYSDGAWGYWAAQPVQQVNSVETMSNSGILNTKTTRFNTDFTLNQDLKMITPGLSFNGKVAMDNTYVSTKSLNDNGDIQKYIAPDGQVTWLHTTGTNNYDYVIPPWTVGAESMNNGSTYRKLYYEMRLNYVKKIQKHEITALGLFSRDNSATGSSFPSYREDWVFRTTYNYGNKYNIEFNGSYNGSEKFSNDYRFQFFPSAAAGWTISQENFMKSITWLDKLKLRGSFGLVGNDNISGRWLYASQFAYGGTARLGATSGSRSPYTWYRQSVIGNPDIRWETVRKSNLGLETSFLKNLVAVNVDVFQDYRYNIVMTGSQQAIPNYFGGSAPSANLGKTKTKGYEVELRLNKRFMNGMRVFLNSSITHAVDNVIAQDQPKLLAAYQKTEGFQIGQYRSQLLGEFYNNWDEVYGSTQWNAQDNQKLPGFYNIVDFNGDGVIDTYDSAPNGYPERPQNTYSTSLGLDYKGFSLSVLFYGVNNVTRYVGLTSFGNQLDCVYEQGTYWSKDNPNAETYIPRYVSKLNGTGNKYAYDGSYLRLKNAEIAYTFEDKFIQKMGLKSLKVFFNGDNLLLWTKLPDDRESSLGGNAGQGAYPTVRRFNLGVNIVL
ncbi:MAG TPA: TonB-dependent receptor [Bacteroidales bacterium]|nr:TonB-dependent receptor [Bacteroidales bacterium]